VKVIHAAEDHIEQMDSVCPVLEEPTKMIQVIIPAPHDLLEQQIHKWVQIGQSFASYAAKDIIVAIMGHHIVMNALII